MCCALTQVGQVPERAGHGEGRLLCPARVAWILHHHKETLARLLDQEAALQQRARQGVTLGRLALHDPPPLGSRLGQAGADGQYQKDGHAC